MSKKVRIFKLAKELNIASDALIEFLRDSGYEVRNINTSVDEDMHNAVMEHFSIEKTLAEQKTEIRRKRMAARGLLDDSEDTIVETVEKKKEPAEKPAILQAIASLQEQAKQDKIDKKKKEEEEAKKPKKTRKKKEDEEVEIVEKTVKKKKDVKKKVEEEVVEVKEEVPVVEEISKVIRTIELPVEDKPKRRRKTDAKKEEDKKKVTTKPEKPEKPEKVRDKVEKPSEKKKVSKPKTAEKAKEVVEEIKQEVGGKVDASEVIRKIDLQDVPDDKPRRSKKQKEEEKPRERKLSKKGLGVAEKIREKKAKADEPDKDDPDALLKKGKKRKRSKKKKIDEAEVNASIKETLAKMEATSRSKKYKKKVKEEIEDEGGVSVIQISEFASVAELAERMEVETNEVIKTCMELGLFVSINQRLDMDTIKLVSDEFGFEVEEVDEFVEVKIQTDDISEENMIERPPVVTIMGHVDHGKTSLLDYIRKANVVAGEKGGITQHIGAYEVEVNDKGITFLDTPGHEAFTAMRARGAQATDVVVLIVAADDSVMPQTLEALNHAQAADVPIIVAINKIDKPGADPDKIKKQLSDHNVLVSSWGGKYESVEISAKKGDNVDELLEVILMQAELLELKGDPTVQPRGVVVESRLEKGKGVVCTMLVQHGTLKVGDYFVCGTHHGRVRAMFNERGKKVKKAGPASPVQVLGFSGQPQAGDKFQCMESEKDARAISTKRQQLKREHEFRKTRAKSLFEFSEQIKQGEVRELTVIIKGDMDGSVEALEDSLLKIKNDEVEVNVIHKSVGAITEADVLLAAASNAFILGFHVRPNLNAKNLAIKEEVDIRTYDVIYDAIGDVKAALEGMLSPEVSEEVLGNVEVREIFRVPKIGTIAGCYVTSGKVVRNGKVKIVRDGVVIYDGIISSLKRFKDDIKEVQTGYECGIGIENYNDLKIEDEFEVYQLVESKRELK